MKKKKCAICSEGKARRKCEKHNDEYICSKCCAEIRSPACEECQYYDKAVQYEAIKGQKNKHFIVEINKQLEDKIDEALALIERGKMEKGEEILQKLLISHPDYYLLNYAMGVVHAMRDEHDMAIEYFNKATDAFPYFMEAYFNMGMVYRKKLDFHNAIVFFKKAIQFGDPQDSNVVYAKKFISDIEADIIRQNGVSLDVYLEMQKVFERAFSFMENRDWHKAIPLFQDCTKVLNNHAQSYGNLGLCYAHVGQKGDAINAFNKALEIDPDYEPAIINKANLEAMKDGEMPNDSYKSVEYYKDKCTQKNL